MGHWFLRLVRPDGDPLNKPAMDSITDWLKKCTRGVVVTDSVWIHEYCSVCWQSPLFNKTKGHKPEACPLLATFNKICKNANLTPLTLHHAGVSANLQKEPVKVEAVAKDIDKWRKEMQGQFSALEKRLGKVEQKCGLKHKAEDDASSTTPQKKGKKGRGKGKAANNNGQTAAPVASGSTSQQGGGNGKGKEKAK